MKRKYLIIIYMTILEFNELGAESFTSRLKQAKLATKDFIKQTDFDEKIINIIEKLLEIKQDMQGLKKTK